MGAWPRTLLLLALALCCSFLLAQPQPSHAAVFFFAVRSSSGRVVPRQGGGRGREEKVPMTVVVPADYSPRPAPLGPSPSAAPAPAPAPAPVPGSDSGGGDEDGTTTPRLPSERRSPGAASSATRHHGAAGAEAASADFISSSPAVPLPAGVADSATVMPMPTPGQQLRDDDVGMGTLQLEVRALQLALPLLIMLSFGRPLW